MILKTHLRPLLYTTNLLWHSKLRVDLLNCVFLVLVFCFVLLLLLVLIQNGYLWYIYMKRISKTWQIVVQGSKASFGSIVYENGRGRCVLNAINRPWLVVGLLMINFETPSCCNGLSRHWTWCYLLLESSLALEWSWLDFRVFFSVGDARVLTSFFPTEYTEPKINHSSLTYSGFVRLVKIQFVQLFTTSKLFTIYKC